jgi:hypothetical protein
VLQYVLPALAWSEVRLTGRKARLLKPLLKAGHLIGAVPAKHSGRWGVLSRERAADSEDKESHG